MLEQPARELPAAVGPEVEEDRRVDRRIEPGACREHDRLDELVGDAALVARDTAASGSTAALAHAVEDRRDGPIGALDAVVAVHRVVAADDGRDPAGGQRREIVDGRMRRDVAAVRERVDPRPVRHPVRRASSSSARRWSMCEWTPPVRDEAQQVDVAATRSRPLESADERRILEDRAVANGQVHAHQILEQHPARADRQVADLRVAHLPRRKADRLTGGGEARVRVGRPEPVEHRRRRQLDGVARARAGRGPSRRG